MYLVKPENANRLMQVWCDQRHDPGGWTVIQRRVDGSVNFFRNWETYKVRQLHKRSRTSWSGGKLVTYVGCFDINQMSVTNESVTVKLSMCLIAPAYVTA